jgi:hypothetical protein
MEKLNYREVKGKPIRIMWANRGVAERRKEGNIFIKVRRQAGARGACRSRPRCWVASSWAALTDGSAWPPRSLAACARTEIAAAIAPRCPVPRCRLRFFPRRTAVRADVVMTALRRIWRRTSPHAFCMTPSPRLARSSRARSPSIRRTRARAMDLSNSRTQTRRSLQLTGSTA